MSNVKLHVSVVCCVKTTGSQLPATTLRCPKQPFSCCCESVSSHLWWVFGWTALQPPPLSAFCWTGLDALPASCLNRNGVGTMAHLIDFFFSPATEKKNPNLHNVIPSPLRDYSAPPPHNTHTPLHPHQLWVPSSFSAALRPLNCLTGCWTFGNFGFAVWGFY